jgi:hypothetical protein
VLDENVYKAWLYEKWQGLFQSQRKGNGYLTLVMLALEPVWFFTN